MESYYFRYCIFVKVRIKNIIVMRFFFLDLRDSINSLFRKYEKFFY